MHHTEYALFIDEDGPSVWGFLEGGKNLLETSESDLTVKALHSHIPGATWKAGSLTASVLHNLHLPGPSALAFLPQQPAVRSGKANPLPINDPIHSGWRGSEAAVVRKRLPGQQLQPRPGLPLKHSKQHKPLTSLFRSHERSPAPSLKPWLCVHFPQRSGSPDGAILTSHIWLPWILTTDLKLWCPRLECGLLTCPEDSDTKLDEGNKEKTENMFPFFMPEPPGRLKLVTG